MRLTRSILWSVMRFAKSFSLFLEKHLLQKKLKRKRNWYESLNFILLCCHIYWSYWNFILPIFQGFSARPMDRKKSFPQSLFLQINAFVDLMSWWRKTGCKLIRSSLFPFSLQYSLSYRHTMCKTKFYCNWYHAIKNVGYFFSW